MVKERFFKLKQIFCSVAILLFAGCAVPPSKGTVEEVIIKYFNDKQYNVLDIAIGDIRRVPLNERQYMGTEGYIVNVASITLEFTRDIGEPWNYKRGWQIAFHNAYVRIKKSTAKEDKWVITEISGIPVL